MRHDTSQMQLLPALCRILPAQSRPLVTSCGQCWERKKSSRESGLAGTKSSHGSWRIRNIFTHMGPSGSKPSRRFLTSRSLGVKSGMRWILTMRSPTTCKAQCHQHKKTNTFAECLAASLNDSFIQAFSALDADPLQQPHRLTKQHAE